MSLAVPHVGGKALTSSDTATSDSWNSTLGSLIVVIGHYFDTTGAAAGTDCTDTGHNVYTLATSLLTGASAPGIAVYYNNGGSRGINQSVTLNGPGTPFLNLAAIEITGQDLTAPFDLTTFATVHQTTTSGTLNITAAGPIVGNQISIYASTVDANSDCIWVPPTGYTNIINQGAGTSQLVTDAAYKINETGTPTLAGSIGQSWITANNVIVTFKEAAGGSPSTDQLQVMPPLNRGHFA